MLFHPRTHPPRPARHSDLGLLRTFLRRSARIPGLVALLALLAAPALAAQASVTVAGVVLDAESGEPVPDVVVGVDGTELRAATDSAGRFRLAGVTTGTRRLVFRHLAYGEHSRDVVIGDSTSPVEIEVRLSQEAIQLSPMLVDVLSEAERQRLASGFAMRELTFEQIQLAQRRGLLLVDLLRQVPGVRLRPDGGANCLEYRSYGAGGRCRAMTVVMDGVPISSDAGTFFRTMDLDEIARLEVLSPGEAGVRFGFAAANGVLLVETRTGPAPVDLSGGGSMSFFDWNMEPEPYRWWRVFATSFAANAAALGLASLPVAHCSHVLDGSLSRRERCHPWVATGAGFVVIALPGAAGGAAATWAGGTPRSRGHRGWSMSLGTLSNWVGALLYFSARSRDATAGQIVGLGVLTLGTPLVETVSDRFFRRLR